MAPEGQAGVLTPRPASAALFGNAVFAVRSSYGEASLERAGLQSDHRGPYKAQTHAGPAHGAGRTGADRATPHTPGTPRTVGKDWEPGGTAPAEPPEEPAASAFVLDLGPPEPRNLISVALSHPVCVTLFLAAQQF